MKIKITLLITGLLLVVFIIGMAGCAPAVDEPAVEEPAVEEPAVEEPVVEEPEVEEPTAEVVDFVTWMEYDQDNMDPAADERVGNEYLRKTMPLFNADFEGVWNWVNVPKAWDLVDAEVVRAVIAGAEVPDLLESQSEHVMMYYNNGTMQDLRPWAEQQAWFADMDPGAIDSCTAPDGSLLCMPLVSRPHLTYVWADHFPDGYPTTPEGFMEEAERLKEQGIYAWTYFGSTAFGGNSASRMYWALISSFGGTYDDGQGNMLLNTPENIAAIEFLRETVARGYNPEVVWAGDFLEEQAFMDASAAAIPTGLFGYRYINPLTAPDGTQYDTGSEQDMLDALEDGQVVLRPMFAPAGQTPGCNNYTSGLYMPVGAQNPEAAYDFINWMMTHQENYIEWVISVGAGFPTLQTAYDAPEMQTAFYQEAAAAVDASVCTPHYGTLERVSEAEELIALAIYNLVKEDPSLDIATTLQAAQDQYNAGN